MDTAPVSVVIPTFNRRDLILEALDSVFRQTLPPAQVIVIDDGSTPRAEDVLGKFGNRILYRYQANAGLSAARNHGIRLSTQPFVAFLDDDDAWHRRKLELQMRCFEIVPELMLLGADQFDWPAPFPAVPDQPEHRLRRVTWEQLVVRTLIPVSSVLVRREVFHRVGDFDTHLRSSEDRDFFLRLAEVEPVGMLRIPLSGYRDTPGSMCKNPVGREAAMRQILRRLDERRIWRGRRLLRLKTYSFMHHTCSAAHASAGNHGQAVIRSLKSLAFYPLPYQRDEIRLRLERPKRLLVNLLRLARLKRPACGAGGVASPRTSTVQQESIAPIDAPPSGIAPI